MNTSEFLDILQDPAQLQNERIFELEDVIHNFPFFQAARVLHLKGLKNQNSFRYNQNLKTTAVHTTDRSVLFHFITSDTFFASKEELKQESEIIHSIEEIDKRVVLNINRDILPEVEYKKTNDEPDETLEENVEPEPLYIDETGLESLQKEVAKNTHKEEIKLLKEKEEENQKITYSHPAFGFIDTLKNEEVSFEIDTEEKIATIDETSTSIEEDEPSSAKKHDIHFEVVNEEIAPGNEEEIGTEPTHFDIDISEPIQFNTDDTHSFNEWLQLSTLKPIDRSIEQEKSKPQEKKMDLIDLFIEKNPKIKPSKLAGFTVNFDQVEEIESDVVMTETLARVYITQKKYQSAIKAYEILSLKFPEKSSFFADQIKMLEELKRNRNTDK